MKKPRSYAVFEDGHEEDLLYFETSKSGHHIFATKSGIYRYYPEEYSVHNTSFVTRLSCFGRLGPALTNRTDEIKYVAIDERIPYEYRIEGLEGYTCGEILVPPDATDQEIRKLIMNDLKIQYRKE